MKKLITMMWLLLAVTAHAQQNFNINTTTDVTHRGGIVGMGSLNAEELAKVNSSGKFSAYAVPFLSTPFKGKQDTYLKLCIYASYNINATNTDSLLPTTVLLPELGKSSFLGTIDLSLINNSNARLAEGEQPAIENCVSLFAEFSTKSIKVNNEDTTVYFHTLNYTLGFRLMSTQFLGIANGNKINYKPFSVAIIPYMTWINIPDEDNGDYRYLLHDTNLPSSLFGMGAKVIMAVDNFQFFADFRNTFNPHGVISNREIKGFTSNIGVIVSAPILEF